MTSKSTRRNVRMFESSTEEATSSTTETEWANNKASTIGQVERGVSFDQDGKSNVWAIEPKMEMESKSSEEKTQSAIFAAGGLVAFVAVAGVVLSNLPDPNQF